MSSIIYSPHFAMGFPGLRFLHPFDSYRARRAYGELAPALGPTGLGVPEGPVTDQALSIVHSPEYLKTLRQSVVVATALEIVPFALTPMAFLNWIVVVPMRWAVAGTLLGARQALDRGLCFSLAGGFHHARPAKGEGFCLFNDIGYAIKTLQAEGRLKTVLYVDLDAHQGNGVCHVFADDPSVKLFDVYNGAAYPRNDEESRARLDASYPLEPGTRDAPYLELLRSELPPFLEAHPGADLLIYNAGTDVVKGDPLGGLELSPDAVLARDLWVLREARQRRIPVLLLPSGGYTRDSYTLISRTILAARAAELAGWEGIS